MDAPHDTTRFHRIVKLKTAGRLATGLCIVAIAILSLLSAEKIARTGLSGHLEHLLAYLAKNGRSVSRA
jgi:hypothetical protein